MSLIEAATTPSRRSLLLSTSKKNVEARLSRAVIAELRCLFRAKGLRTADAVEFKNVLRGALSGHRERALAQPPMQQGSNNPDPNSIAGLALAHGMKTGTIYGRLKQGMTLEEALTTPVRKMAVVARAHGMHPVTVCDRLRRGMTLDEALSTPVSSSLRGTFSAEQCRQIAAARVSRTTVYRRMRKGWSFEKALVTPPFAGAENARSRATATISNTARAHGLPPACVFSRIKRGWSLERALATPIKKKTTRLDPSIHGRIAASARERGIDRNTVYMRMRQQGLPLEEALTRPVKDQSKSIPAIIRARGLNIKVGTVLHRVKHQGMSLEEALTRPVKGGIAKASRARGINASTVWHRMIHQGMSFEDALTLPVRNRSNTIAGMVRARGLSIKPDAVCLRIRRGWSLEDALTTPLDLSKRRAMIPEFTQYISVLSFTNMTLIKNSCLCKERKSVD